MAGYVPVFDTVLDGTLYGKWPHTGVWLCLLSQCDRLGHIDVVPGLLAAKIGLPLDTLMTCISDFMQPDPGSRTAESDGRRLELLDMSREWGWRVINHAKYREKARKKEYDTARTASGKDAERKQEVRSSEKEVPRSPAKSRALPLSDADAKANSKSAPRTAAKAALPENFQLSDVMRKQAIERYSDVDADEMFVQFQAHHRSHGKVMKSWEAAWVTWLGNAQKFGYPRKGQKSGGWQ